MPPLDLLTMVLVVFGLGLTLLTGLVCLGAFCISAIAYTIWVERTGGLRIVAPTLAKLVPSKEGDDVPEGFKEDYQYWTDPKTGRRMLLPKSEVEALKEDLDAEQNDEIDVDKWVFGKVGVNSNGSQS